MKITYIHHSSFIAEHENAIMLFDFFEGGNTSFKSLPPFDLKKHIYVFASHRHGDHFDPCIFKLFGLYENITFILSKDIRISDMYLSKKGIPLEIKEKIIFISENDSVSLYNKNDIFKIETLKSTDEGVAFIIKYNGKTLYHAGDLNWWAWKEEDKQYNKNMEARFKKEIDRLRDVYIDAAFLPLDLRQEEWYYLGFDYFMSVTNTQKAFPMHFWNDFSVIDKIISFSQIKDYRNKIAIIKNEGQEFYL
ncbi:MAG: folD2 [Clostridia bacterium]|nr:folD2 [Clostridia bacterium]